MIRGRPDYRLVEHSADVGLLVRAPDQPRLFEAAAAALFDVMVDISRVEPEREAWEVSVTAPDRETLLVAWLSELLSAAMAEGRVFGAFEIRHLEAEKALGRAWGETLDPDRHGFKTEIKAVTYHGLEMRRAGKLWEARLILDL